jgi:hypothetical protein
VAISEGGARYINTCGMCCQMIAMVIGGCKVAPEEACKAIMDDFRGDHRATVEAFKAVLQAYQGITCGNSGSDSDSDSDRNKRRMR